MYLKFEYFHIFDFRNIVELPNITINFLKKVKFLDYEVSLLFLDF
jgi:hypothetical protein